MPLGGSGLAYPFNATPIQLAQSNVQISAPADLNDNVLYTVTIPPLAANDAIRVSAFFAFTNSANNKICNIKWAGNVIWTRTRTTTALEAPLFSVRNRNATNSQISLGNNVGSDQTSSSVVLVNTYAIDTSVPTTLTFTAQKSLAGESITLESAVVEILKGA